MKVNQSRFLSFLAARGIDTDFDVKEIVENAYSVTFVNPMTVANFSSEYQEYLLQFDKIYSDGQLLTNYFSKHFSPIGRYSFDGNSIAPLVFAYAKQHRCNLALIGSTLPQVQTTGTLIENEYSLAPIFTASGYDICVDDLVTQLYDKNIDIAIFGLGQIRQESMLLEIKSKLPKLACFTCGGYIHQVAGKKRLQYYPKWVNKYHLRAPYRVCDEGTVLLKRYLFDYADFYHISLKS